jgi:DNA-binding HxlR family transcriptional regulator
MSEPSYMQFCPVAMASELLCRRWTMVVLRELVAGSTRFNDLRRGVPRMSPALLSRRLKELEAAGVIRRVATDHDNGAFEYRLTQAGRDLRSVVESIGFWGQRWVQSGPSLEKLDVSLLMWDMRRNLRTEPMPRRRSVIHFQFPDLAAARRAYWLVIEPGEAVDLCSVDMGFDVDLYVTTDLRTMTAIWMGVDLVAKAVADGRVLLTGDRKLAADMQTWLGLSPFARERKLAS